MKVLFLFLDGVGLGENNPRNNPFARQIMPNLQEYLGGRQLLAESAPYENQRVSLLSLDACLGVAGLPQSATGQATLLTGQNVPAAIGYHFGPKPNPVVAEFLKNGNLFSILEKNNRQVSFLNAYPPRYFEAISSGRRMYAAIPLAATSAGLPLKKDRDLFAGQALSADFTGQGWREFLGIPQAPVLTAYQAGQKMATLARSQDFSFFEYWLSDYAGHHQDMAEACALLEDFDQVFAGLVESWDDDQGLILITSDHGNLEDLSTRRHTTNPVPALLVGAPDLRHEFARDLSDLTGITPAILHTFLISTAL